MVPVLVCPVDTNNYHPPTGTRLVVNETVSFFQNDHTTMTNNRRCHRNRPNMLSLNELLTIAAAVFSLLITWCPHVTGTCPIKCQCLEDGAVVLCNRAGLVQVPSSVSDAATTLELDYNHISIVTNGSLHRTPRLRVLSMHDNGILYLEAGVFDGLRDVRIIRIGRNHISSLPRNLFANNRRLEVLDLHANYFATMPDDVMFSLGGLRVLNASFNQLTSAELGPGFQHTRELSVLDLSGLKRPTFYFYFTK